MKILRLFVFLSTLLCAVVAPSPARAQADVSFDFFYDSLAPYGDWVEVGDYGLCWTPTNVDPDWTPYSDGYFAFTDGGWTWVSYEEFGGIVYHYGRWIHLDNSRWCWMPAYDWAPCWVSWRHSANYIGWAPLPPEARWRRDVGISIWADSAYDIGPGYYHFCRPRDFGAPVLRAVIVDPGQNLTIIRETVNITNITYNTGYAGGPVVFVGGPNFDDINLVATRPIPALKLVRNANFDAAHWREHRGPGGRLEFNARTVGNQLIVAAPLVAPPSDPSAFKGRAKTVIAADKVNKGWGLVKNPDEQNALRQEFRRQSKGLTPETAPARAMAATELKSVPATADPHATPPGTASRHERAGKGQRPESIATQPNIVPPTVPSATPPTTADRHERPGRGQRPESVVTQPTNVPPSAPITGNPVLKPFTGVTEQRQNPRSQNPPGTTFTPNPTGVPPTDPGATGNNRPRSVDPSQQDRAAEQARIRAEQDRIAQQKQAQIAAQQQKQIAAQHEAAKMQAEESRRHQVEQQRALQIQQQQLQQKQQAQQQQQQVPQSRGMDPRRAQDAERARQQQIDAQRAAQIQQQQQLQLQQKQQAQQQQQQQIPQSRGVDPRRAQDAERARQQQVEAQRGAQIQQQQQEQQRAAQIQQQQQLQQRAAQMQQQQQQQQQAAQAAQAAQRAAQAPQHSNQPPPSQPPPNQSQPGAKGHSRDSKDGKDKDKNGN